MHITSLSNIIRPLIMISNNGKYIGRHTWFFKQPWRFSFFPFGTLIPSSLKSCFTKAWTFSKLSILLICFIDNSIFNSLPCRPYSLQNSHRDVWLVRYFWRQVLKPRVWWIFGQYHKFAQSAVAMKLPWISPCSHLVLW